MNKVNSLSSVLGKLVPSSLFKVEPSLEFNSPRPNRHVSATHDGPVVWVSVRIYDIVVILSC